tara:strand:+ start:315 stop:671 length:357 start_codon:yes stop_codon:yes gene_type:complete
MNSAVKKMEDDATRAGYRTLIKAMNKLTGNKEEKKETKAKKSVKKPKKKKEKEESPEVTDELKDLIKGFFHKEKPEEKEAVDLHLGSKGMKKTKQAKQTKMEMPNKKRRNSGASKSRK